MLRLLKTIFAGVAFLFAEDLFAALQPAKVFSDNMVLQQGVSVPVWGSADVGANVVVEFAGQRAETRADNAGRWKLEFEPLSASAEGRSLSIRSGNESLLYKNVVVGEVWFSGGQSNMGYSAGSMAKRLAKGKALVAAADYPGIRFRKVNEKNMPMPQEDLKGGSWFVCTPNSVKAFSAVGFIFARRLHEKLKVPIGIIDCSWGGTPIEPYIPAEAFTGHPTLERLAKLSETRDYEAIKAMRGGTFVRSDAWLAGAIYNARIAPVVPYAIRGAIWYQAESNCGTGEDPRDYAHKMRALIQGWRGAWGRPDLPFYYVQLPQWRSYAWTYAREEQRRAMDVPNTGMVVTIDLDFNNDIHPPNKIDVGERLARWPLAKVYRYSTPYSGPTFRSVKRGGNVMSVKFNNVDGGLIVGQAGVGQVIEIKGGKLFGFELADEGGGWHAANALIRGNTVAVSSVEVSEPKAVRYACHPQAPEGKQWNLYNGAKLPASPFCSDWSLMPYDPKQNPMPK
jgi:sialate O-acetylesterase